MTKEKCINYAQTALMNVDFKDGISAEIFASFFEIVANDESSTLKTRYSNLVQYKRIIIDIFAIQTISKMNVTWFINALKTKVKDRELHKFMVIVLYFLEKEYILDNDLNKLLLFRERFEVHCMKHEILYLLENPNFEQHNENGLFDSKDGIKAFFNIPSTNDFIFSSTYNFVSVYIEHIKLNSTNTHGSLANELWQTLKMQKNFLQGLDIRNLNFAFIKEYLLDNENTLLNPTQFIRMIFYGINNDYFKKDYYLSAIQHLEEDLCNFASLDTLKQIFFADDPGSYYFVKTDYSKEIHYIPNIKEEILAILMIFLANHNTTKYTKKKYFSKHFRESLGLLSLKSVYDFNYTSLQEQISFFLRKEPESLSILVSFYLYIFNNYNGDLFKDAENFHVDVLQRQFITREIVEGYEFVPYSQYETYPSHDKWIFYYPGLEGSNLSVNKNASSTIDFTTIHHPDYRELIKYYLWNDTVAISTRIKNFQYFRSFVNFIYDIKTGNQLSYFSRKSDDFTINANDIIAYKNYIMATQQNHVTRNHFIYDVRKVLVFLDAHNKIELDKASLYHLSHSAYHSPNTAQTISNDGLEKISQLMKSNAELSLINSIYYAIFYILLETEFRVSQVLTLEEDCVFETYKSNQYVIKSTTKRSPKDKQEQPITIYVKRQLDEIKKMTEEFRNSCQRKGIKKYLFIVPSSRKNMYKMISRDDFNIYLKKCCKELGIPEYTSSNLRDTHMTKTEEYAIRNSITDSEQSVLTGHLSPNTTSSHYIDTEIRDLLESVHGIIIGNTTIDGKILPLKPNNLSDSDIVSNKCGYCSSATCDNFSYLDCMLCKSFVTCIDRIPYFEEQLQVIDYKMHQSTVPHDLEDLRNIKVLLATYLKKLLVLKKEVENA